MVRAIAAVSVMMWCFVGMSAVLKAEIKTEEKNQFKMEGMMGRVMGMFGGKAAKDGVVSTTAVKGDRKVTVSENRSEIIDLAEEKVYEIDLKKRTYKVTTFEEMRQRLQKAREDAARSAKDEDKEESGEKQLEFDFSLKESGQKRTINGYDCREVIMTVTGHEKGKSLEEGGGMVLTSNIWIGPEVPAMKEFADFNARYAKAMDVAYGFGSAEQMAAATALYPGMKEMIERMQAESMNTQGVQVLIETTMEIVKSAAEMSREKKEESEASSASPARGLGGMIGRRLSRKKDSADEGKSANRSLIFTTRNELLKVETSVPDSDVAIPANFKEKK
ncbi:MAG: hypothetical protein GXX84_10535 [Acidobacteria bacterium]|nr:hypothetical protein [Acidobacteriota bacterium]